ncbi:MAG: hypothetical protein M3Y09_12360 [Actinomycetota bacterium]|nr:hypothetical protein [Actinomycetota bacterium]
MGRDQLEEYGWSDEDLERLAWPPTVNPYVLERDGHQRPLARRNPASRTGFEFGYTGAGPTELAICILLDFFEVYEQAPDLPVNFYGFRNALTAPADHDAERMEIGGMAIVAWMATERHTDKRLLWRRRHVGWSVRRRPGRGAPPMIDAARLRAPACVERGIEVRERRQALGPCVGMARRWPKRMSPPALNAMTEAGLASRVPPAILPVAAAVRSYPTCGREDLDAPAPNRPRRASALSPLTTSSLREPHRKVPDLRACQHPVMSLTSEKTAGFAGANADVVPVELPLAMQKVESSSLFSRLTRKPRSWWGFLLAGRGLGKFGVGATARRYHTV